MEEKKAPPKKEETTKKSAELPKSPQKPPANKELKVDPKAKQTI